MRIHSNAFYGDKLGNGYTVKTTCVKLRPVLTLTLRLTYRHVQA